MRLDVSPFQAELVTLLGIPFSGRGLRVFALELPLLPFFAYLFTYTFGLVLRFSFSSFTGIEYQSTTPTPFAIKAQASLA
jgi:hypothetical protein